MSLASLDPIPLFREVHPEVHQPHSAHLHKSAVHKPLWRKLMVKSGMTYTGLQFFNLVDLMQGLLFSCKIPQTFPPEMATFFFFSSWGNLKTNFLMVLLRWGQISNGYQEEGGKKKLFTVPALPWQKIQYPQASATSFKVKVLQCNHVIICSASSVTESCG